MKTTTPKPKLNRPPLDFKINIQNMLDGFTQSEMQTMDNCAEKWYLSYNMLYEKKGEFSWALHYGSAIHAALEEWYSSKCKQWSWNLTPPDDFNLLPSSVTSQLEYYDRLGKLQLELYTSHYKQDRTIWEFDADRIETIADFEWEGIRLKGMLDIYAKHKGEGKYYMWDHKTASRLNPQIITGWDFRFQFMFYCWLASKLWKDLPVKGYVINAIKKPELRQGVTEPLDAFMVRISKDMLTDPKKYFYREKLNLKKEDLLRFEKEILGPKIARLRVLRDPKTSDDIKIMLLRNKNTDHCLTYGKPCAFLAMCQHGAEIEKFQYRIRDVKHRELASEEI